MVHGRRDADVESRRCWWPASVAPVSRGVVVASRSVICSPEQKMFPVAAPSPASSLYTLFTPWRQVVRHHPVPHGRRDPVNPRTSTYSVVALSFCTLERRRSGDWRTHGWKKIYTKTVTKTVLSLGSIYSLISLRSIFLSSLKVKKLNEKKDFFTFRFKSVKRSVRHRECGIVRRTSDGVFSTASFYDALFYLLPRDDSERSEWCKDERNAAVATSAVGPHVQLMMQRSCIL